MEMPTVNLYKHRHKFLFVLSEVFNIQEVLSSYTFSPLFAFLSWTDRLSSGEGQSPVRAMTIVSNSQRPLLAAGINKQNCDNSIHLKMKLYSHNASKDTEIL